MHNFKIYSKAVKESIGYVLNNKKNPITKSVSDYIRSNSLITISVIETLLIHPLNFILLNHVEIGSKKIGKHLKHNENIDNYIQLTRFIDSDNFDRINCDWCSIVNGFNEFTFSCLKNNRCIDVFLSSNILFYVSYYEGKFVSMLPNSSFKGYIECSNKEADNFIINNNITFNNEIEKKLALFYIKRLITLTRIVIEIEKRWCPFGYMQDIAYERNYYGTDLEAIVKELREFGKVVCTSCVSKLNETHEIINAKESIYKDFLIKIKTLSNG